MYSKTGLVFLTSCFICCKADIQPPIQPKPVLQQSALQGIKDNPYPSIAAIPLPAGFHRPLEDSQSFSAWLRQFPLKKDKTVFLYNGQPKINQAAQFAVLDLSTGNTDLQQCADAVMRLRAEYLFKCSRFSEIIFKDNESNAYRFTAPFTKEHLQLYLQIVFARCGTASLSKQMHAVSISQLQAGDVLIHGGYPGHAVMVMDVATDSAANKIFLIAQGYMPAQDMHVLVNPLNKNSPWYHLPTGKWIVTPEYYFQQAELKRW